jgi:uncharacterized protein (DUF1330 family)
MRAMHNLNDLVEQLVATHGEEGVCPAASDWRAILAQEGAIHILNLLKFRPSVETDDGPISGAEAYGKYSSGVTEAFAGVGGQRIFRGHIEHMFSFGTVPGWDAAVVTRYPSADALAQMWLDPRFIAAHDNRVDGVEQSQVFVFGE